MGQAGETQLKGGEELLRGRRLLRPHACQPVRARQRQEDELPPSGLPNDTGLRAQPCGAPLRSWARPLLSCRAESLRRRYSSVRVDDDRELMCLKTQRQYERAVLTYRALWRPRQQLQLTASGWLLRRQLLARQTDSDAVGRAAQLREGCGEQMGQVLAAMLRRKATRRGVITYSFKRSLWRARVSLRWRREWNSESRLRLRLMRVS